MWYSKQDYRGAGKVVDFGGSTTCGQTWSEGCSRRRRRVWSSTFMLFLVTGLWIFTSLHLPNQSYDIVHMVSKLELINWRRTSSFGAWSPRSYLLTVDRNRVSLHLGELGWRPSRLNPVLIRISDDGGTTLDFQGWLLVVEVCTYWDVIIFIYHLFLQSCSKFQVSVIDWSLLQTKGGTTMTVKSTPPANH